MAEQISKAPEENFSRGLRTVEIPELGEKISGKVRDMWITHGKRVIVTTDRQSAFDHVVGTVPGKGAALNLTSAFWFEQTAHIVPNHAVAVPHPNVLIAREIPTERRLPIEVIIRAYMAEATTKTSIYHKYIKEGRRTIYGISFPEGLRANEQLPELVITPTTKAETGHDEELTNDHVLEILDEAGFGEEVWGKVTSAALQLFQFGQEHLRSRGLILVDTKYEFGVDEKGEPVLIDEVHTPDSSRFWLAQTYEEQFRQGLKPESFDKEILRRWLKKHGFDGDEGQEIPAIDHDAFEQMALAYRIPYEIATDRPFPDVTTTPDAIRDAVIDFFHPL